MVSRCLSKISLNIILTFLNIRIDWKSFTKKFPEKRQSKRHYCSQVESDQLKLLFMFQYLICVIVNILCVSFSLSIDDSITSVVFHHIIYYITW